MFSVDAVGRKNGWKLWDGVNFESLMIHLVEFSKLEILLNSATCCNNLS